MLHKSIRFAVILSLFVYVNAFANDNQSKKECIEKNLLMGLETANTGLQLSCAYYLGELKTRAAVLPLMNLLRSAKDDNLKIVAALSLIKIGDERGVFLVERTSIFDNSEAVRKMSNRFYIAFRHAKVDKPTDFQEILAMNK